MNLSSMQFATHSPLSIGDEEVDMGEHQTGKPNPNYRGVPDVVPLSSATLTSADRTTAWRLHRNARSMPQPYSKRTAGSIYKFGEE